MGRRRRVRVPGSSANLGPGFDAMAAALSVHMELEVSEAGRTGVEVRDSDVLITRSTFQHNYVNAIIAWGPTDGSINVSDPLYTPITGLRITDVIIWANNTTPTLAAANIIMRFIVTTPPAFANGLKGPSCGAIVNGRKRRRKYENRIT